MKESNLKFSNPFIKKIDYEMHPEYKYTGGRINLNNAFSVNIYRDDKNNSTAFVELDIVIGNKEASNAPFYVNLVVVAQFLWDEAYDEKTISSMLSINAPALLLSYARPIVSTITSMSPFPVYNIPFYNFTQEE